MPSPPSDRAFLAVASVTVGGGASVWERLGFHVEAHRLRVGHVDVVVDDTGAASWALRHAAGPSDPIDLDGIPTEVRGVLGGAENEAEHGGSHPNGVTGLDHVVIATPRLDRTTDVFAGAGLAITRQRDAGTLQQRFVRLGQVVIEIVGPPEPAGDGPARIWGLAFTADDLDATVTLARARGAAVGEPHDAVQPGRRIAGVERGAGLPLPVAFLTPRPPRP